MLHNNTTSLLLVLVVLVIIFLCKYCKSGMTSPINKITTIITTAPLKSMPSIDVIKQTIDSLKLIPFFYNNPVIIAFDGAWVDKKDNSIHPKCRHLTSPTDMARYDIYKKRVKEYASTYLPNATFVELPKRGCLKNNLQNALDNVKTKYINIVQDDLVFVNSFDVVKLINIMEKRPDIKYIRYVDDINMHNRWTKNHCHIKSMDTSTIVVDGVALSKSNQYVDQNHLTTLDYYRNIIMPEVKSGDFMEHHHICKPYKNFKKYGSYFLGSPKNNIPYMKHIDGRNY
jgi:hypothetical protein